jgi:arsenate reductase
MIIYGIKNCDVTKKALNWLEENGVAYTFHDYKEKGVTSHKIEDWLKRKPLNELINSRGTTYKGLSDADKEAIAKKDVKKSIVLMMENTSIIKRPLVETGNEVILGFDEDYWDKHV